MSNRKYHRCTPSRTVTAVLLLFVLPVQIPGTCACRMLDTPCTTDCQCAAQKSIIKRQCSNVASHNSCDSRCSADSIDHSPHKSQRECRCTSGSPLAVTRLTTSVEIDPSGHTFLDQGELIHSRHSSQRVVSPDLILARGQYTSLERCVSICRLTL